MQIISGFFVYKVYVTYKAHFTQKGSDISKYNFRIFNMPYESFLKTKGQHYYDRIATKIKTENDVISLFIAAFMDNPDVWIGDIYLNLAHYMDLKNTRESRIDNISYLFKKDCINLLNDGMTFDDTLGRFIFNRLMESNIEIETFIIFKKIFNLKLDNLPLYDYIYKGKYEKYEFLLKVNTKNYKIILEEIIMTFRD